MLLIKKAKAMTNILTLEKLLSESEEASKLKFSEEILRIQGEVKLFVPMEDAESLYLQVDKEISYISEYYEFIQNGLKHIEIHKSKNSEAFHMNAYTISRITKIYEKLELPLPSWVPSVWVLEKPYLEHNVTYLFNWSTVEPSHVSRTLISFLVMRLSGEIKPTQPQSLAKNSDLKSLKESGLLPKQEDEAPAKIAELSSVQKKGEAPDLELGDTIGENAPEEVNHGSFVAKKYLMLMKSASDRNLEFNLSIDDLSQMLRKKECHFTGETLVCFAHCRDKISAGESELPANYLTIDRLDSEKGYVSGNVVVCGNEINQLKDRMPSQEFSKAIAMRKLLREANMSPEMMRIIAS